MSLSGKTVYRVRQLVANEVAIISEVKEGESNGGKVRETRDTRMTLGGADSFWLVGGEKKEKKHPLLQDVGAAPAFSKSIPTMTSPMATLMKGASVFDLPSLTNDNAASGKLDAVSFAAATRLEIGFSPAPGNDDATLSELLQGTLRAPLKTHVSAIEIRPGQWLRSGFEITAAGCFRLTSISLREVPTITLENRPDMIRLSSGVVVFVSSPRWGEARITDLRPHGEIIEAADRWLSRIRSAVDLAGSSISAPPSEILRMLVDSKVSSDEKADLEAVAAILSEREDLLAILPSIMERHATFREMMATFEEREKTRLSAEIDEKVRIQSEDGLSRLAELRRQIAEAEAKIETFTHREALLRSETERHEEELRRRIDKAALSIRDDADLAARQLREEVARLREEVSQVAAKEDAPREEAHDIPASAAETAPSAPPLASPEQRQAALREMAVATGLSSSQVAAVIASSTETVPVILGDDGAAAAVDIVTALAGERAAVVFCDPTRVSLSDLLLDENSGLQAAIDSARRNPEVIAAAALCGITNGPCEYWLPQIVEMRRAGRLPRNLAIVASAGTDGTRVPVPGSVLRHLFPLTPANPARPGSAVHQGAWPAPAAAERERFGEALDVLVDAGLEGVALQKAAKTLARAPEWIRASDLVDVFKRQAGWLEAALSGSEHDDKKYFELKER
ncbi:hypothetical protein ACWGPT_18390 [Pseudorhizobium sp. NPDC055634]